MKTLSRIGIWTAVAAVVLAVAGIALTTTPWFQRYLQRRLTASLTRLTGGRVQIRGMRFHPLLLEVAADRVVIHGLEPRGQRPLLAARGLVIEISPATLWDFQLRLRQFSWKSAVISISTGPSGATNVPGPQVAPSASRAVVALMNLSASTMTLADTAIYWNGKGLPFSATATNLAVLLRETGPGQYAGSLASAGILLKDKSGSLPPLALSTQFSFTRAGTRVNSLTWRLGELNGKGQGTLSWDPSLQANFQFTAAGEMASLARVFHLTELRNGLVGVEGRGKYVAGRLHVQGRGQAEHLDFQWKALKPAPMAVSFHYVLDHRTLSVPAFRVTALQGQIQGSATAELTPAPPRLEVHAALHHLDLASLFQGLDGMVPLLQAIHPAASLSGHVDGSWSGAFEGLTAHFALSLQAPSHPRGTGMPVEGSIQGTATGSTVPRVTLTHVRLKTPHSTIQAQGSLGAGPSPLSFHVVTTDFQEWRPLLEFLMQTHLPGSLQLQQPASFSGVVSGALGSTLLVGELQTGRFQTKGWVWSALGANVRVTHDTFQVTDGRLTRGQSSLSFGGSAALSNWQLVNTSRVHVILAAQGSPLGGLMAGVGIHTSVEGAVTGKLDLAGTPLELSGSGFVQVRRLRLGRETLSSVSTDIQVRGSHWDLEHIRLAQGPGLATGAAHFDRSSGGYFLHLEGKDFSLARLVPWTASEGQGGASAIRGRAHFNLLSNGTLAHPIATMNLTVAELAIDANPIGTLGMRVNWQGQSIVVSGQIQGVGGEIHFTGQSPAAAPWPLTLTGTYQALEIAPWIHLVAGESLGASVTASGAFHVSGPLKHPALIRGRSEIHQLKIRIPPLSFENDRPVSLSYAASSLRFSSFHMKGPGTDFSVTGSLGFGAQPKLALDITGGADATLLSLLDPSLQAVGGSQLKVHVGGTPTSPALNGSMAIRNVSIGYADLPIRLSGLNGTLQFHGDRAVISSLKGVLGGGETTLSGFVTLQGLPRYQIRARLRQVRIHYPADFTSVLDGRLRLEGTAQHGEISGGVAVRNLFVSPNFNLLNLLAESNNRPEIASTSAPSSLARRMGFNIRVSSPQGLRLDTRDAHLVADVALQVRGTLAHPVVLGDVHAESGNAIFQGNRYTITRGDLTMNNPLRTEPLLDLEARTRVERYDLTVEVSGPLDRLHLAYRSDPPLPVEDIVSLIALGYSRQPEEAGLAASGSRGLSSSVGASALLSQALSSQVGGRIQQLFGVSRIKINPEVNEPGVGTGPRVTVEQQLSPDFTVTYITNTNNSLYQVVRVEWDLSQDVSVIGMRDQNGIIGMELKFRHRFK